MRQQARLLLCALILTSSTSMAGPLSNGSFERFSGDLPVGWERFDTIGKGEMAQDTGVFHAGSASLRLGRVVGVYGIGSEKLPFYPWSTSLTVTSWVKADRGGKFVIWLIWYNRDRVVRTKRLLVGGGTYDWKQVALTETEPPDGAGRYQVIVSAETGLGHLWADEVTVTVQGTPATTILVNQVGYRTGWPKSFVVQSAQPIARGTFEIVTAAGAVAFTGTTRRSASPQGWPYSYLRGDFTTLDAGGSYLVRLQPSGVTSHLFAIADDPYPEVEDLGRQFFYYQRCGTKIAGWHNYCHIDDGDLGGTHLPAIGGWHDAGDYIKTAFGQPLTFFALAYQATRRVGHSTYDSILDEAKWGSTILTQFINPSTGRIVQGVYARKSFWGRPEDETDGVPGNSDDRLIRTASIWDTDNQLTGAGFALLSPLLSRPDQLQTAIRLWEKFEGLTASDPGNLGRLIIIDTVLYAMTQESRFRTRAHSDIAALIALQGEDGGFPRYNVTDRGMAAAGLAYWALANPGDSSVRAIKSSLRKFIRHVNTLNRNPFGIMQYDASSFFLPYRAIDEWKVGENSDYLSVAWAMALARQVVTSSRTTKAIIQNHLDWVMGKNPFGVCMVHGAGSSNPRFYHHRYDSIPGHENGAVPGAVPNGLIRESIDSPSPRFDVLGNAYETNEPWVPHNSYLLLALSEIAP